MGIKEALQQHLKNIVGWRTKRKIVVFSVDDYGNVRLDSKEAGQRLRKAGLTSAGRFDDFDALETREDLERLYEVLGSVRDANGRHAVFTPFAIPCNIDFEQMAEEGYTQYKYEFLTETFRKQEDRYPDSYRGAWELWQEGIRDGFMVPQFHGREHFNLKTFQEKLNQHDDTLLTILGTRSYAFLGPSGYSTIGNTAAFDFWELEENNRFGQIIREGLEAFEKVFGYKSVHFNAPGGREHPLIHMLLHENGVKYIDTLLRKNEHQGMGTYRTVLNYTGKQNALGQIFIVRNALFEPTEHDEKDWIGHTLKQIGAAFRWNRPAIISSHRVNFCGHIDPTNRKEGLGALQNLLRKIMENWPEVEFMSSAELGACIEESRKQST
jgi:hypothetical protein